MTSYRKQRAERKRLRFSVMGKASQRVQAERRMAVMTPERLNDKNRNLEKAMASAGEKTSERIRSFDVSWFVMG